MVVDVPTKGEARHIFKTMVGERPVNCKGTRKRLPAGLRVRLA